ncbi:hypothetical protein PVAG01_04816 [Phlyctema vagabunda]|uniref:Uncharacterized protein n=1 Tax=Phlyctema vagabunda TaxID=108571 RepID=A0ABR4PID5_9HELO
MLDENLPTFFIKPSSSDNPLSSTIFLSQHGSELQPEYTLRRPNPELPASHNKYGVALYDSYNPEVLFAEVLVEPEWTQPTLSQAEIRAQNGVAQPPVPIVPNSFVIQLYNPDQQVTVRQIASTWNSSAYWEFEMPQNTFRIPSASALDRSQSDPAASDLTPKVAFKWRRDGKLSKDISCVLAGKTTNGKKSKEPDIVVAMFKGGKDLTIYQPNMHRVDVEDNKGLEVVFILSAAVIKDVFFNPSRDMFNIRGPMVMGARKNSGPQVAITGRQRTSSSPVGPIMSGAILPNQAQNNATPASQVQSQSNARPQQSGPPSSQSTSRQREIDAETARLKALVEAEEKEQRRLEKERQRIEVEEQRRIKVMLEEEERARKRRDDEVAKETERLRKQYGVPASPPGPRVQFNQPPMPPRPQQQQIPSRPQGMPQNQSAPHSRPIPVPRPQSTPQAKPQPASTGWFGSSSRPSANASPYLHAPGQGTASASGFFGLGGRHKEERSKLLGAASESGKRIAKKRSVFF